MSPIDPISVPEAASPLEGAPPLPVSAEPMPLVSARVNTEIDLVDVVLIGAVTVISFLILGIMAAAIFMATCSSLSAMRRWIAEVFSPQREMSSISTNRAALSGGPYLSPVSSMWTGTKCSSSSPSKTN